MKKICSLVASLALLAPANLTAQKLTILHLNDTHSHIDAEKTGELKGHGGTIERAACIDSVRTADGRENVLLLHAGDFSQGSSYFTVLGGFLEIDLMNAMGFDATALGNHEFDNGTDALADRLAKLKCPVVCANYDFSGFRLGRYVKPYVIVRRGGLKIGIIGLLTDVRPVVDSDIACQLKYQDPIEVTDRYADYLRNRKKCDMVICLTHLGIEGELTLMDRQLVAETRNVDLVIGGHSHTFLKDVCWQENADGVPVPIVQNGRWGVNMANLKIELCF